MTRYRYSGPASAVTLNTADGPLDVVLFDGTDTPDLPADNEWVVTMVALKHFTELPATGKAKKEG